LPCVAFCGGGSQTRPRFFLPVGFTFSNMGDKSMSTPYYVRQATLDDIPILVAYRRAMFESMGVQDAARLTAMCEATRSYLGDALPSGVYRGWVAEADGRVIASGGLVIQAMPPSPRNMDGRQGYIMNVYTEPAWRNRGVATAIVTTILDYLREINVPVVTLHASEAGRPLYQRMGFVATNEMRLVFGGK
jgi:GNAT superfamily N-acetyltransferase